MFGMNLTDKSKIQKLLTVLGWIVIGSLVLALVFGIISATSENGEGFLGFSSYRYDEDGYTIGSSTIRSDRITNVDLDWIAGEVEVVLCQDAFPSITESYDGVIAEKENLCWKLSEDGTSFSVKYRKSTALLSLGGVKEKKLILRIPEKLVGQLEVLSINANSADVTLNGVSADTLSLSSNSGDLTVLDGTYDAIAASTGSGDMDLSFLESFGFTLAFDGDSDRLVCNRTLTDKNGALVYGDGAARISLSNQKGQVKIQLTEK